MKSARTRDIFTKSVVRARFYRPAVNIGVIGQAAAGKSTLLRIVAYPADDIQRRPYHAVHDVWVYRGFAVGDVENLVLVAAAGVTDRCECARPRSQASPGSGP